MKRRIVATTLTIVVGVISIHGAPRPDFSGDWTLSLARSAIDPRIGAGLESGRLRITHTGSRLTFERVFVTKGKEDRSGYELATDGTETEKVEPPITRRSRLEWDGDVLVLQERLAAPQGEATNTVRYRLLDEGRTFEAREGFRGPKLRYDNVWVFEKRGARHGPGAAISYHFPRMQ
jgi:hypothetical protein